MACGGVHRTRMAKQKMSSPSGSKLRKMKHVRDNSSPQRRKDKLKDKSRDKSKDKSKDKLKLCESKESLSPNPPTTSTTNAGPALRTEIDAEELVGLQDADTDEPMYEMEAEDAGDAADVTSSVSIGRFDPITSPRRNRSDGFRLLAQLTDSAQESGEDAEFFESESGEPQNQNWGSDLFGASESETTRNGRRAGLLGNSAGTAVDSDGAFDQGALYDQYDYGREEGEEYYEGEEEEEDEEEGEEEQLEYGEEEELEYGEEEDYGEHQDGDNWHDEDEEEDEDEDEDGIGSGSGSRSRRGFGFAYGEDLEDEEDIPGGRDLFGAFAGRQSAGGASRLEQLIRQAIVRSDSIESSNRSSAGGASNPLLELASVMSRGPNTRFSRLAAAVLSAIAQDTPYAAVDPLQELCDGLLMMPTHEAERGLAVGKISEAAVAVLADPILSESAETQIIAARLLFNLVSLQEIFSADVVAAGALPVLKAKLSNLAYIDLAEQVLQTLQVISVYSADAVLRAGCVAAALEYVDFFTVHSQRKVAIIAANCCGTGRSVVLETVEGIFPVLATMAGQGSDSVVVEKAWLAVTGILAGLQAAQDVEQIIGTTGVLEAMVAEISAGQQLDTALRALRALARLARLSSELANRVVAATGPAGSAGLAAMVRKSIRRFADSTESTDGPVSMAEMITVPKDLLEAVVDLLLAVLPRAKLPAPAARGNMADTVELSETSRRSLIADSSEIVPLLLDVYPNAAMAETKRACLEALLRIVALVPPSMFSGVPRSGELSGLCRAIVAQYKCQFGPGRTEEGLRGISVPTGRAILLTALTLMAELLQRLPERFAPTMAQEGLLTEAERIKSSAEAALAALQAESDQSGSDSEPIGIRRPSSGARRHSTWQSNAVRFLQAAVAVAHDIAEAAQQAQEQLGSHTGTVAAQRLKRVSQLAAEAVAGSAEPEKLWQAVAELVADQEHPLSSSELLGSGVPGQLVGVLQSVPGAESAFRRQFLVPEAADGGAEAFPAFAALLDRLQEALGRVELFELATSGHSGLRYGQGGDYLKTSLMAKQIRIKLVPLRDSVDAEDAESGEDEDAGGDSEAEEEAEERAVIVSVHAIATFTTIGRFLSSWHNTSLARLFGGTSATPETHVEFFSGGERIPTDTTVYGAVRQQMLQPDGSLDVFRLWNSSHPIKYRRVPGPQPRDSAMPGGADTLYPAHVSTDTEELCELLEVDEPTLEVLQLLRELYGVFRRAEGSGSFVGPSGFSALHHKFVNPKLSVKLARQLDEILIIASGTLPRWSVNLTRQFPFLFPFERRMQFLRFTSFGYSRLIQAAIEADEALAAARGVAGQGGSRMGRDASRRPDLGRLIRYKARVSRKNLLGCAVKILLLYGSSPNVLEIEYFDEEGSGLGPTLEFYAKVSRELCRKKLRLWRENNSDDLGYSSEDPVDDKEADEFVYSKNGLFPAPLDLEMRDSSNAKKILKLFSVLGMFVARSLLDGRLIDLPFSEVFFQLAHRMEEAEMPERGFKESRAGKWARLTRDLELVARIDPKLGSSLRVLAEHARKLPGSGSEGEQLNVADLALDFTLPGYPEIKLKPGGELLEVTEDNLEEYVELVVDYTIGSGVESQITAFRDGFSHVFPYSAMTAFYPEELVRLFGNADEDWSVGTLMSSLKADHGFTMASPAVVDLMHIMSEFTKDERRRFLQFVSGSPRLPVGGFKALKPAFTVVCKQCEAPGQPDDYLPSVMTCANYLKLPNYSSREVMKEKLLTAISEGSDSFLLS